MRCSHSGRSCFQREAKRHFENPSAIINAQPHRYDLVITNMTLPNMTGKKLAVELIRIRPNIPIILCTGYGETLLGERLKNIGIKTLVMKPVLSTELAKAIQNALDNK